MSSSVNYRKFYKNYYNIDFDNTYDIHHIDLNHNNNKIDNLLLLPKKLHQEYHKVLEDICAINTESLILNITSIVDNSSAYNYFAIQKMNSFLKVYSECQKWANYKAYLDGLISNIHNIEV